MRGRVADPEGVGRSTAGGGHPQAPPSQGPSPADLLAPYFCSLPPALPAGLGPAGEPRAGGRGERRLARSRAPQARLILPTCCKRDAEDQQREGAAPGGRERAHSGVLALLSPPALSAVNCGLEVRVSRGAVGILDGQGGWRRQLGSRRHRRRRRDGFALMPLQYRLLTNTGEDGCTRACTTTVFSPSAGAHATAAAAAALARCRYASGGGTSVNARSAAHMAARSSLHAASEQA